MAYVEAILMELTDSEACVVADYTITSPETEVAAEEDTPQSESTDSDEQSQSSAEDEAQEAKAEEDIETEAVNVKQNSNMHSHSLITAQDNTMLDEVEVGAGGTTPGVSADMAQLNVASPVISSSNEP